MASTEKANDWMAQAERKLKGGILGGIFGGGGSTRQEEAAEMYVKAANMFKLAKKWEDAGKAFIKAAECVQKSSKHEAATNYINAANCLKKFNNKDAIDCLHIAVEMYTDEGRFSIAAKHQKEIAELYEEEMDLEHAMEAYQTSADYYDGEGSTSSANQMLLKVAQYAAQLEKYEKAIEIYEEVARKSIDNSLLKWSVKDYYLKAGLCHLCNGDLVSAKRALEKYQETDVTFSGTREFKFLQDITAAFENYDVEAFTTVVVEYDQISKIDQWKTSVLLKIKSSMKSEDTSLI